MFDNISARYDLLNHLLTFGIDIHWRKKAVSCLKPHSPRILLDVATGTGDFAMEALTLKPEKIIGIDLSDKMMDYGRAKARKAGAENIVEFMTGDCEQLPFANNTFDAITVGFGVRNFENLEKGLSEMLRVLKPGGHAVILEATQPQNTIIRHLFSFYFVRIVPMIGRLISKDARAYAYLPESVGAFPAGSAFVERAMAVGFREVTWKPLTWGACALYLMKK